MCSGCIRTFKQTQGSALMDFSKEWNDLDHVSDLIEQLRRISPEARLPYYRKLLENEDLIFVSWVGHYFMEWFGDDLDGKHNANSWILIKADVNTLRRIIEGYSKADNSEWVRVYKDTYSRRRLMFNTGMGNEFLRQLYEKLNPPKKKEERKAPPVPKKKKRPEKRERGGKKVPAHALSFGKRFVRGIAVLSAVVAIGSLSIWIFLTVDGMRNKDALEKLRGEEEISRDSEPEEETEEIKSISMSEASRELPDTQELPMPEVLPEYADALATNAQLFGWIECDGMGISLPVTRPEGQDDFYLHHDFYGDASDDGCLFVDSPCSIYPRNRCIVIYGHNMRSGAMFGNIDYYADPSFLKSHSTVRFDTIYEEGEYEAFCTLRTRLLSEDEEGFRYYRFYDYENKDQYKEFKDFIKSELIAGTTDAMEYGDHFLLLSSCEYSQENGRLVVVCRQKTDE